MRSAQPLTLRGVSYSADGIGWAVCQVKETNSTVASRGKGARTRIWSVLFSRGREDCSLSSESSAHCKEEIRERRVPVESKAGGQRDTRCCGLTAGRCAGMVVNSGILVGTSRNESFETGSPANSRRPRQTREYQARRERSQDGGKAGIRSRGSSCCGCNNL